MTQLPSCGLSGQDELNRSGILQKSQMQKYTEKNAQFGDYLSKVFSQESS